MVRRRRRGQGSVYERKDGIWVAQFRLNGKTIRRYARTKTEAEAIRRHIAGQGGASLSGRQTVEQFLDAWYESEMVGHVRYRSDGVYRGRMALINRLIGDIRLDQLNGQHLASFKRDLPAGSAGTTYSILRRALYKAVEWGHIASNPAAAQRGPGYIEKTTTAWSEEQIAQLLDASRGTRWHALWIVLGRLGLRKSEALGLKWDDIDWTNRRLHVDRQLQFRAGEGFFFVDPKNATSRRTIILAPNEMESLQRHQEICLAGRQLPFQDKQLVFCRPNGLPLTPSVPNYQLELQSTALELPKIRVHDLRHTAATHLIKAGVPMKVVSEQLGHGDVMTTQRTYVHVDKGMQEAAARARETVSQTDFSERKPQTSTRRADETA